MNLNGSWGHEPGRWNFSTKVPFNKPQDEAKTQNPMPRFVSSRNENINKLNGSWGHEIGYSNKNIADEMNKLFEQKRKSYIEIGQIYFWTATINKWQNLLLENKFKDIIISSLQYLSQLNKIDIYAFVIMPNHIHVIWRINEINGKETSQASFLKYTAHAFKKLLNDKDLVSYRISAINKNYEFWQRDSLAVHLYSSNVAYQKLDYLHNNPTTDRWSLVDEPSNYLYSSASFYENSETQFKFLKDLRLEF